MSVLLCTSRKTNQETFLFSYPTYAKLTHPGCFVGAYRNGERVVWLQHGGHRRRRVCHANSVRNAPGRYRDCGEHLKEKKERKRTILVRRAT